MSSLLGPVDPSLRALSGRRKFTFRRHTFNKDSLSKQGALWREVVVFANYQTSLSPLEAGRDRSRGGSPSGAQHPTQGTLQWRASRRRACWGASSPRYHSLLGPVDPSFRALSVRPKFTARRLKSRRYMGTSLARKRTPLGPCRMLVPRSLRGF